MALTSLSIKAACGEMTNRVGSHSCICWSPAAKLFGSALHVQLALVTGKL